MLFFRTQHSNGCIFPFILCLSLLLFSQLFVRPPQTTILHFCIGKKASGGDGLPVELFQMLKDDAVKVLHSIYQQIWKTQQWPQDWKRSAFIPIPKKGNTKECSNYHTIALISHSSKLIVKILQARLQQYMNHGLPNVQAGFRKGRGPEIKLPTSTGSQKKQENLRKTSTSALLITPKPLCGSQQTVENS